MNIARILAPLLLASTLGCSGVTVLENREGIEIRLASREPRDGYVENNERFLHQETFLAGVDILAFRIYGPEENLVKVIVVPSPAGASRIREKKEVLETQLIAIVWDERLLFYPERFRITEDFRILMHCTRDNAYILRIALDLRM